MRTPDAQSALGSQLRWEVARGAVGAWISGFSTIPCRLTSSNRWNLSELEELEKCAFVRTGGTAGHLPHDSATYDSANRFIGPTEEAAES